MNAHLPECPVPEMEATYGPLHPEDAEANCFCDALRACENRVRLEDDDYAYVAAQSEAIGWKRGLDAAREAVFADLHRWGAGESAERLALGAIDALRNPAISTTDDGIAGQP